MPAGEAQPGWVLPLLVVAAASAVVATWPAHAAAASLGCGEGAESLPDQFPR